MNRAGGDEADIQTAQPQAGEQARISSPHEDARRPQDPESAQAPRPGPDRREGRREVVGAARSRSERLPRDARIRASSDIGALIERGKRRRTRCLDVFFAASPASRSRLGLIVPKHGRRVVDRNLLKRRLREIGRREILPALEAMGVRADVLVRARRDAYAAKPERLAMEMKQAVEVLCSDES
jgi:ribonuclease P protein component